MRIGLTGAQGVLGRRLVEALTGPENDIRPFPDDVRDAGAVGRWTKGLDVVVHAAAVVPVKTVTSRLGDAISVNVGGTANVARAVAETPGCRLVYLSTSHVYAPQSAPLSEDAPTEPTSLYGLTKLQGEAWVRSLVADPLIIRIFSFFDSRQMPPFLVPSLAQQIREAGPNATIELKGAACVRDLMDGRWVARVGSDLIKNARSGTVNCGTGNGHTVLEIAQLLAEAHGRSDISWWDKGAQPADAVIADTRRLEESLGPLPPANLSEAFADSVSELGAIEKIA